MRSYPPRELYLAAATPAKTPLLVSLPCCFPLFSFSLPSGSLPVRPPNLREKTPPHNPSRSDKIARYATRDRIAEKVSWERGTLCTAYMNGDLSRNLL